MATLVPLEISLRMEEEGLDLSKTEPKLLLTLRSASVWLKSRTEIVVPMSLC